MKLGLDLRPAQVNVSVSAGLIRQHERAAGVQMARNADIYIRKEQTLLKTHTEDLVAGKTQEHLLEVETQCPTLTPSLTKP